MRLLFENPNSYRQGTSLEHRHPPPQLVEEVFEEHHLVVLSRPVSEIT
jgi:hypothetical protein